MSKIKPRKGWSVYSKPWAPTKPKEPKKTYVEHDRQVIGSIKMWEDNDNSFHEIPTLPEGVDPEHVVFVLEREHNSTYALTFYNTVPREVENPNYEREMKAYKKELEGYEVKKVAHQEELKEWKAWVKQDEEANVARQLKHAEELLKKHGRKVE